MKDELGHYIVSKDTVEKVDMEKIILTITSYVQNNEVYFKYNPHFYAGSLIFGVMGLPSEHKNMEKLLRKEIKLLKCKIERVVTKRDNYK